MEVRLDDSSVMLVNEVQYSNANQPMEVRLDGSVMLVNEEQYRNA